jgi:hypothetical protein
MNNQNLVRAALGYLTVVSAQIGFWALLAPQSFFDNFPGLGRAWVAVDGPYNEHLVRDVGALNLALVALLVYAMIRLSRELVTVAGVACLAWGVPHFVYHVFNTDGLATGDVIASLGGLAAFVAFAAMLLVVARNPAMVRQPVQS